MQYEGQERWSKRNDDLLKKIALTTDGAYIPAGTQAYDLGQVYADHLAGLTRSEYQAEKRKRYREQFQWFVGFRRPVALVGNGHSQLSHASPLARPGEGGGEAGQGARRQGTGSVAFRQDRSHQTERRGVRSLQVILLVAACFYSLRRIGRIRRSGKQGPQRVSPRTAPATTSRRPKCSAKPSRPSRTICGSPSTVARPWRPRGTTRRSNCCKKRPFRPTCSWPSVPATTWAAWRRPRHGSVLASIPKRPRPTTARTAWPTWPWRSAISATASAWTRTMPTPGTIWNCSACGSSTWNRSGSRPIARSSATKWTWRPTCRCWRSNNGRCGSRPGRWPRRAIRPNIARPSGRPRRTSESSVKKSVR